MAEFQVTCVTRPANQRFILNRRGDWSHVDNNNEPACYPTRAAAYAALRRSYKHPADDHKVVQTAA